MSFSLALGLAGLFLCGSVWLVQAASPALPTNVAPQVWEATSAGGEAAFLVILKEQATLDAAAVLPDREARLHYVYDVLRHTALRSQAALRAELDAAGVDYRTFYIVNMLVVHGDRALITRLAAHPEVARIAANPYVRQSLPEPSPYGGRALAPTGVAWGVGNINADDVWALGYDGTNIVIAGQDTGYEWDHPALINQYRGYSGITATHDYNWHDAIHEQNPNAPPGNPCGFDSPVPCDDYFSSHGTHTMGTMVGDDGGSNQIGVAPGARWIGCRNMEQGWGTPATYAECFEFFLAPYPIAGHPMTDGVPSLAPHVINNSWACPPSEGCDPDTLTTTVENVRAAGIVVVASTGNTGPQCSTVQKPPAIYEAAFSVGATDGGNNVASFSSRGPVTVDGSGRRKPDVAAPGVSIRSSVRGDGYSDSSGTSMAAPHVAGTVALLYSAAPYLVGDVDAAEGIIEQTARPRTTAQECGGDGHDDVPNNVYGWGIVDALAAVRGALVEIRADPAAHPPRAGASLTYTIRVTNTSVFTLHTSITDILPAQVTPTGSMTWTPTIPPVSGVWTQSVAVSVQEGYTGLLTNVVRLTSEEGPASVHTSTVRSQVPQVTVTKRADFDDSMFLVSWLHYTISVTNTSDLPMSQVTITDTIPTSTTLAWADGDYLQNGSVVTWMPQNLAPRAALTVTLAVTVTALPPGTDVVNDTYGVWSSDLLTPVMGNPLAVTIPWRYTLALVERNEALGGDDDG